MKSRFVIPFVAAVLGGGVTAAVLVGAGVVDSGETTTIYEQSPLGGATRPASTEGADLLTPREIYKRDAPGVVFVRSHIIQASQSPFDMFGGGTQESESTGSGFVIDTDGHILTNAHVVDNATSVTITFSDKKSREAKIVGKDESTDLALLKVDPKGIDMRPLELGDSKSVQVGDQTIAIGNPFGYDRTLTTGVVSALQRRILAPNNFTIDNVIQTDAAINPGNSGGPLIDASGRVIGINSQIATGGTSNGSVGIGFAIPINTAKDVISALKTSGHVERPWLGLEYVTIDPSLSALNLAAKSGLLVQQVIPGGPAAQAGIRDGSNSVSLNGSPITLGGDIITRINGRDMKSSDDVTSMLQGAKPGDKVTVEVLRDGHKETLELTLGNRPAGKANP
jgi:putative serine protease PepD